MTPYIILLYTLAGACLCRLLMPLLLQYSRALCLIDAPAGNKRKVHSKPIPAIGGLVIAISIGVLAVFSDNLQQLLWQNASWTLSVILLLLVSVLDDRLNLPAYLRFGVQLFCAWLVAKEGFRITSLYGIMGIETLPETTQYLLTIFVITGITNAFNLIDGIDGLAGSLALVNLLVLSLLFYAGHQLQWLFLLLPLIGALLVFLTYNWNPARVFLGDGGSVVLGFIVVTLSLYLSGNAIKGTIAINPAFIVKITGALVMIPATDTLRVFYHRIKNGVSPFSADKNHLHHWFLRHRVKHSHATKRLLFLQLFLLFFTLPASLYISGTTMLLSQFLIVVGYTLLIQLHTYFMRWYFFIKRMEYKQHYQYR